MKKKFDCVEMQHRGGELVRKMTEGMTVEEEVAFWKARTAEMLRRHSAPGKEMRESRRQRARAET
jgi:uncharacterized protein GlcG (DUF336 family)